MSEPRTAGVSIRTTADLRDRLTQAAKDNGRSLAQEVEWRLLKSFGAPGATLEDVRIIIAETVRAAVREEQRVFTGPHTHSFLSHLVPPYEVTGTGTGTHSD